MEMVPRWFLFYLIWQKLILKQCFKIYCQHQFTPVIVHLKPFFVKSTIYSYGLVKQGNRTHPQVIDKLFPNHEVIKKRIKHKFHFIKADGRFMVNILFVSNLPCNIVAALNYSPIITVIKIIKLKINKKFWCLNTYLFFVILHTLYKVKLSVLLHFFFNLFNQK